MPKSRRSSEHSDPCDPTGDRYPARPWIQGGIDYGPGILPIHDLAAWAFEVAERDVSGWPEGRSQVYTARRFVLARIRGKRARRVPFEDVVFTAELLARIFDGEMRLGTSEVLAILDALHLPTDVVPLSPRPAPQSGAIRPVPRAQVSPLPPGPGPFVAAEPDGGCDDCGEVHPFICPDLRNAA